MKNSIEFVKLLDKIIIESDKVQIKIENKENKLRGIYPSILITSFKGKTNSSTLLLNKLRANNVDKLELTNSFKTSEKELKNKIKKNNYKYIISLGQKGNINDINIELIGSKNNDKIKTNFPYKAFISYLNSNGISNFVSNSAGNYLCNNIYYEGLKYINENKLNIKMIFIHIPPIRSNYNFEILAKTISNFVTSLNEINDEKA